MLCKWRVHNPFPDTFLFELFIASLKTSCHLVFSVFYCVFFCILGYVPLYLKILNFFCRYIYILGL